MRASSYATLILASLVAPAFADVTVSTPINGSHVTSPFTLSANAASCSSQSTSAMSYSFDNSAETTILKAAFVQATVVSGSGVHTLHVMALGVGGSLCVTDVSITVQPNAASSAIPPDAIAVHGLQIVNGWLAQHDTASVGGSSGSMSLVNAPSRSGNARKFVSNYSKYGDQRFSLAFGDDTTSSNFFLDGWVYLPYPSTAIANVEMDMNQVIQNGQTVIFGFQCDGWSGTWDYTANAGTPSKPIDVWLHSKAACNPHQWSTNTWHHIQVGYSRDNSGNVTYKSVWLDSVEAKLNVTVPSAFALGWAPTLVANFQLDGSLVGSGTAAAYLDDLTIYRW